MKVLLAALLMLLPVATKATCTYETTIRLGIVWYRVSLESTRELTRSQVISRLALRYNFHDVGKIYKSGKCHTS